MNDFYRALFGACTLAAIVLSVMQIQDAALVYAALAIAAILRVNK